MGNLNDERVILLRRFLRDQRRRAGLSQEDLAELTKYALTTMRDLEAGRLAHPSAELLGAVAAALRMSPAEREFLWSVAASSRPPITADGRQLWADEPVLRRLVEDAYPDPAFLIDPAFRVHVANSAVAEWLVDFSAHPDLDSNIALWMFTHPHARHVFPDWEHEVTPVMIGRIRAMHGLLPEDPCISGLIDALCQRSARAKKLWLEDSTIVEWPKTRRLRLPGHTDPDQVDDERWVVTTNVVFLNPPADGDERLMVTFLLPNEHRVPGASVSERACVACARQRAAASPGAA